MKLRIKLRTEVKIVVALIGLSCLIAFGDRKQNRAVCHNVVVKLENTHDNYFVSKADVLTMIEGSGNSVTGKRFSRIDLRALENNLTASKYIADAQLYGNVKGALIAKVKLRRPIARLVRVNFADLYIAEDGTLLPVSNRFCARSLLISGHIVKKLAPLENIYRSSEGRQLMKVLLFIGRNPFWKAQIAQINIDKKGKMHMYPQVTDQRIEFGELGDIEVKFKKLMIFYKEILPQKGWTKYDRVNVEYENQIIAE